MKKRLVIFGAGQIAELAHYYFSRTDEYSVVAFTVDEKFIEHTTFCGLDVVPFEILGQKFSPASCEAFVALSYAKLNAVRKEKFDIMKERGYRMASFVSPHATVLNEGKIGENCFILEDNTIQPFSKIGDNVTLWSGNHIGHHSTIGDHTFVASHVVVSGGVSVGQSCFIGVNATIRDHIKIGDRCVIGAGAILLEDAEEAGVYVTKSTERSSVPSNRLRKI